MDALTLNKHRKVVIVGAGAVGAAFCYALAQSGLADEIALIDPNESLVKGQVLDLVHGQPFFPTVAIHQGDPSDYGAAQLVVVTAGAAQKPGQTRLELMHRNASILRSIMGDIVAEDSSAVVIVVSNPVDVMTHVVLGGSGLGSGRVLGSGTVLDSARFRYWLSQRCQVDARNVHAYVIGEHGDSEVLLWSLVNISGIPLTSFCKGCPKRCGPGLQKEVEEKVRNSAYHIIEAKGFTNYGVSLAMLRILGAIMRDEKSILTVSAPLNGEYGINDLCLGIPSVIGSRGVERVVDAPLSAQEGAALQRSADLLRATIENLGSG